MSWNVGTALALGRVSNLPTVWTNTLAGVLLAGVSPFNWNLLILLLAMSLAYTGGMFLNDAFDRKIDAKERPERPIPSGKIKAAEVFAAGFTQLAGAIFFTLLAAISWGGSTFAASAFAAGLCVAVVIYNRWHKGNTLSPVIMGLCRALVLLSSGYCASKTPFSLLPMAAVAALAYVIGLTYVAKQENIGLVKNQWPLLFLAAPALYGLFTALTDMQTLLPTAVFVLWSLYCLFLVRRRNAGDIPRAVVSMIAGIALADAIFIASVTSLWISGAAFIAFAMTLVAQRYVAGT
ncbi:MAG: UbiA family prenyltransferase [Pseudomonadota bacterium]